MKVDLKLLVEAEKQMKFLLHVADKCNLPSSEYMPAFRAWSALHANVDVMLSEVKVEVEA
jgi:hypothetical protein